MATFGQDLKAAREARGVALADIARETKVSLRHLQALEDDRFDALPGGVFNRGIVRNYLQFLRLDQTEWLEKFEQAAAPFAGRDDDWPRQAPLVPGIHPSPPGQEDVRFRWLGVGLLFLVLLLVGWFAWKFAGKHWQLGRQQAPRENNVLLYCVHAVHWQAAPPHSI